MNSSYDQYYFNARYYDATIGRFINVDPIQDGQNWYVYCSNNPMCFVDPTGLREVINEDKNGKVEYADKEFNHGNKSTPTADEQLKELETFVKDVKKTGEVDGIDLYLKDYQDGCFARAYLMGEKLKESGFNVTYADVEGPTAPGGGTYNYHTAPTVNLVDGNQVIIDPLYSSKPMTVDNWAKKQGKKATDVDTALKFPRGFRDASDSGGYAKHPDFLNGVSYYSDRKDLAKQILEGVHRVYGGGN